MPVGIDSSHTQAMPDDQRPSFPLRKAPCHVRQEDESKTTECSKVDAHESSCKGAKLSVGLSFSDYVILCGSAATATALAFELETKGD